MTKLKLINTFLQRLKTVEIINSTFSLKNVNKFIFIYG